MKLTSALCPLKRLGSWHNGLPHLPRLTNVVLLGFQISPCLPNVLIQATCSINKAMTQKDAEAHAADWHDPQLTGTTRTLWLTEGHSLLAPACGTIQFLGISAPVAAAPSSYSFLASSIRFCCSSNLPRATYALPSVASIANTRRSVASDSFCRRTFSLVVLALKAALRAKRARYCNKEERAGQQMNLMIRGIVIG